MWQIFCYCCKGEDERNRSKKGVGATGLSIVGLVVQESLSSYVGVRKFGTGHGLGL